VGEIVEALGCNNFKKGQAFYTCSNPDGDAKAAINISIDSLKVLNHTRPDFPERADIITLVEYVKNMYFTQAIKWICDICGYQYYFGGFDKEKENDPCLLFLEEVEPNNSSKFDEIPLRKLDENVLNEYVNFPNLWFYNEGISFDVQQLFEVGFSVRDNCITIPIRDELGELVGIKGRTILDYEKLKMSKYWFPYPAPKSLILYGLDKAYSHIKDAGEVIVYEAEKSVQKSFSYGYCNAVSIGGHDLSQNQVMKLEKLGVDIVLAFDKNVTNVEWKREIDKFLLRDKLYVIYERKNSGLLGQKDAPVDLGLESFLKLYKEDKYKVK